MGEFSFTKEGTRPVNVSFDDDALDDLKILWKNSLRTIPAYPQGKYKGRGIVICAGGLEYITCAYIAIRVLRAGGCELPIEVWHMGYEVNKDITELLEYSGATCKAFSLQIENTFSSVALKPVAILESSFEEVLFLDADNVCLKDPSYLFDSAEYRSYGQIFWPDFWKTEPENPIFEILECGNSDLQEQESGQLLINKKACWKEINLTVTLNRYHAVFYHLVHGDKDTFKFAWLALKRHYYMIPTPVSSIGYYNPGGQFFGMTMAHCDPSGHLLFLHRNLLKWQITFLDEHIWKIWRKKQGDVTYSMPLTDGNFWSFRFEGAISDEDVPHEVCVLEKNCLTYLQELRQSNKYQAFALEEYIRKNRKNSLQGLSNRIF